jgi:hypothetical protein
VYTTTTGSLSSYGTQSGKRITTINLSGISLYRTNHTAETLVLELTFCALQMVVIDLVHQYHIDQTVNISSSVTLGQSFASCAKCSGMSRAPSLLPIRGYWMVLSRRQSGQGVRLTTDLSVVSGLRMSGAIPPLSPLPSWIVHEQLCLHLCLHIYHNSCFFTKTLILH